MRLIDFGGARWMRRQGGLFYIGILTWMAVMFLTISGWLAGEFPMSTTISEVTPIKFFIISSLFFCFLFGYVLTGDVFSAHLRYRKMFPGMWLSGFAFLALSSIFQYGIIGILAIILVAQLPEFLKLKQAVIVALCIPVIGAGIDILIKGLPDILMNAFLYGLFNLFAVLASFRFMGERNAKKRSEQLVRELNATQVLLSATTKRDERLRVARDVHDVLGHHLTALSLQLEVACHTSGQQSKEHILQAQSICRLLLSDVRETVSALREEKDIDLKDTLLALCKGIPGLDAEIDLDLEQSKINARIAEVIFRCVQEAITNTIKHADAERCLISLSKEESWLILFYKDNGVKTTAIKPGNGLKGMSERVAKVDGEVEYRNKSDGFEMTVKLPDYMI